MSSLTRRLGRKISSTGSDLLSEKLKNLDAYPKTLEDFRVKTYTGAASMYGPSTLDSQGRSQGQRGLALDNMLAAP